jgi:hypothetical protein
MVHRAIEQQGGASVNDQAAALRSEIMALLELHDRAWTQLDFNTLSELWDADEQEPWYIADELGDAAIGWSNFRRYWQRLAARMRTAEVHSQDLRVRRLAADLAIGHFVIEWSLQPVESNQPNRGHSRALAVFRRRDGQWRFSAVCESSFHRAR